MAKYRFTTEEFAVLVNRDIKTLYSWAYYKKLQPHKDFSGHNIYTEEDYKTVTGLDLPADFYLKLKHLGYPQPDIVKAE